MLELHRVLSQFQYNNAVSLQQLGLNLEKRIVPPSLPEAHDFHSRDLSDLQIAIANWAHHHIQQLCSDVNGMTDRMNRLRQMHEQKNNAIKKDEAEIMDLKDQLEK